jgi:hypothetical protein
MNTFAYLITVIAMIITVGLGIYVMDERFSASGALIMLMVIVPYLFGLWLLSKTTQSATARLVSSVLLILSVAGSYILYDALFIHPDAQSGLVFFVLPVYGLPVVILSAAAVFVMQRHTGEK